MRRYDQECLVRWHAEQRVALSEIADTGPVSRGGIKETLVAIGKSTKRGQKRGLFVMQTHAHDR